MENTHTRLVRRDTVASASPANGLFPDVTLDMAVDVAGSRAFGKVKNAIQIGLSKGIDESLKDQENARKLALANKDLTLKTILGNRILNNQAFPFGATQGAIIDKTAETTTGRPRALSDGSPPRSTISIFKDSTATAESPVVQAETEITEGEITETKITETEITETKITETEITEASIFADDTNIIITTSDNTHLTYNSDEESVEAVGEDDQWFEIDGPYICPEYIFRLDGPILAPVFTTNVKLELAQAKRRVKASRGLYDVIEDLSDSTMMVEYAEDIFTYFKELEAEFTPDYRYELSQTEVTYAHRSVLLDWLVQVHERFNLLPETLFLAVNIIDRFLSIKVVSISKLQLVGATALFIAAKYEEVNAPTVAEMVFMVDKTYTTQEIQKAESFMLSRLDWKLGYPGPMSFLRAISKADNYNNSVRTMAKYLLEVAMMDERFIGTPPSLAAAGSHCMARMIYNQGGWSFAHVHYSGYTYAQLYTFMNTLLCILYYKPERHHYAVTEKYKSARFGNQFEKVQLAVKKKFVVPTIFTRGAICDGGPDVGVATYPSNNDYELDDFQPGGALSHAAHKVALRILRTQEIV